MTLRARIVGGLAVALLVSAAAPAVAEPNGPDPSTAEPTPEPVAIPAARESEPVAVPAARESEPVAVPAARESQPVEVPAAPDWAPAATAAEALGARIAPPSDGQGAPAERSPPESLGSYWGRRLSNAQQRIDVARERAEKADASYSRARHKHNPRGEALEELREKRGAAERELQEAEAALPRLVEQARHAGVEPGIFRDYQDEP